MRRRAVFENVKTLDMVCGLELPWMFGSDV
jgi:hypothetical protein